MRSHSPAPAATHITVADLINAKRQAEDAWTQAYLQGHQRATEELEALLRQAQATYLAAERQARAEADAAYQAVMAEAERATNAQP